MTMHAPFVATALLGATLAAQTYVVDAANGPGTHFTDLPAAVAVAPDGAVLLVRPGAYNGFQVGGKGLAILGEPGATITGNVTFWGLLPHQDVTLRELTWTSAVVNDSFVLELIGSGGRTVLLDRVTIPANTGCSPYSTPGGCTRHIGLYCYECSLTMRECAIGSFAYLEHCDTVVDACTIAGEDALQHAGGTLGGRNAVYAVGGTLQVAGQSSLRGGDALPGTAAGSGIRCVQTDIRLLSGTVAAGANGINNPYDIWFSPTGGTLRMTTRATVGSASVPATLAPMPELAATPAQTGGTVSAGVVTEPGDAVFVLVGLSARPLSVAGFEDPFWLDPATFALSAIGTQSVGAPVSGSLTIPASPAFVGLRLHWQAACLGPTTGAQTTNPASLIVH